MGVHAPLFKPFERSGLALFLCEQSWRKVFADTTNFFSREFSLRGDDDNITDTLLEPLNSYLFPQYLFLLSKIYDGRCSTETFLKTATLSVLVWAYPRKMKTRNGNFKNAAILPRQCYYGNIVAPIPLHAYMFSCDTSMRTHFAAVFLWSKSLKRLHMRRRLTIVLSFTHVDRAITSCAFTFLFIHLILFLFSIVIF